MKRVGLYSNDRSNRGLERCIRKLDPGLVVASWAPQELIHACRAHDVPIVEVLHGHGFDVLPDWINDIDPGDLPDGFVTFDRKSFETFNRHFGTSKHVIQLSKRQLFSGNRNEYPFPDGDPRHSTFAENAVKTILVTLSARKNVSGAGFPLAPQELIDPYLLSFIRQTSSRYRWKIRPHPSTLRQLRFRSQLRQLSKIAEQLGNSVEVSFRPKPMSEVARELTFHITYSSESCVELAEFGVPSMQLTDWLPTGSPTRFEDLVTAGVLIQVSYREIGTNFEGALKAEVDPVWREAYFEQQGSLGQMVFKLLDPSYIG